MFKVLKKNQRLVIVDMNNNVAYAMPFWIHVNNRADLQHLADQFNLIGDTNITAIIQFESKFSTVKTKKLLH
jgi:hypothetical protein